MFSLARPAPPGHPPMRRWSASGGHTFADGPKRRRTTPMRPLPTLSWNLRFCNTICVWFGGGPADVRHLAGGMDTSASPGPPLCCLHWRVSKTSTRCARKQRGRTPADCTTAYPPTSVGKSEKNVRALHTYITNQSIHPNRPSSNLRLHVEIVPDSTWKAKQPQKFILHPSPMITCRLFFPRGIILTAE